MVHGALILMRAFIVPPLLVAALITASSATKTVAADAEASGNAWPHTHQSPLSVFQEAEIAAEAKAAAPKKKPRRPLPQPKAKKEPPSAENSETTEFTAPKQAADSANAVSVAKDVAVGGDDNNYKRAKTLLDEEQGPTQAQTCNTAGEFTQGNRIY